ncbi:MULTISPECIES: phosphoribosyltransferase [Marinobacter]|uniref:Phosphoribosyltransferase family protein n=1 Tax=Marinobacter suaedae TaxID=3057675 RepID=A0ABT8VX61_9GAMM|nr:MULTISPECIES: phosphoribosyltransferase family protein [unclassified Marinobacter]MBZ2168701.1 hypoxanthine phosphoribosyltransferase [Marinobacter sp. F4216]MDO3720579.1 phosphoribosyltransferase family protein [Marinobacter sp. chi1]
MNKHYLEEEDLILDAFRLGVEIFKSGFRPTFIVGLWRGGSSIGIYVQECLQTLGVQTDHIAVRTSYRGQPYYHNMVASPNTEIRVHGTQYLLENLNADDGLLIVDDVFSTGLNIKAVIDKLERNCKRNMARELKVATLWQRPAYNQTNLQPDYCLHRTDDWLVFPYELNGLTMEEIREHKPFVEPILDTCKKRPGA